MVDLVVVVGVAVDCSSRCHGGTAGCATQISLATITIAITTAQTVHLMNHITQ